MRLEQLAVRPWLLHSVSAGRCTAYQQILGTYGASQPSRHRIHQILSDVHNLGTLLESTGITIAPSVYHELRVVMDALRDPGPFFTFTHGDATPANVFVTSAGVRRFDFDTSAFRHALLDGAFARLRYLYSVWARRNRRCRLQSCPHHRLYRLARGIVCAPTSGA